MLKKLVLFVAAVMLLASSAQATLNVIPVDGTNPPIFTGSSGQAGVISLTFEHGTKVTEGESIRLALPVGVALAKNYDLYLKGATGTDLVDNSTGPLQGTGNATDLILHVSGIQGKDTIILDVKKGVIGSNNATQTLRLVLFDGDNATKEWLVTNGEYDPSTRDLNGTVSTASAMQNTLCITVEDAYKDKYVTVAGSSSITGLVFTPTAESIAEVKPKSITPVGLKAERTVALVEGQAASCMVDYETGPFCALAGNTGWGTGLSGYVAVQNGASYPAGRYTVTAEILVDGAAGAKGAYFGGAVDEISFVANSGLLAKAGVGMTMGDKELYLANGKKVTSAASSCAPADDEKVVKVVSTTQNPIQVADAGKKFLRFDIPSIWLVKADLPPNAKIGVKITVSQNCGTFLEQEYKTLFTVVEKCSVEAGPAAGELLFPYFADAPFWNGMALTNTGDTPVNASLAIVDEKGGKGSIDIMVPANGMYVNLVEKIIADSAFNGTVDKALRCYITVTPQTGRLVGFAMMGNAGESMGYTVNN